LQRSKKTLADFLAIPKDTGILQTKHYYHRNIPVMLAEYRRYFMVMPPGSSNSDRRNFKLEWTRFNVETDESLNWNRL
jgi:hypothetical protein